MSAAAVVCLNQLRDLRTNRRVPVHGSNISRDRLSRHHDRDVFYRTAHDIDPFIIAVSINGSEKKTFGLLTKFGQGKPLVPGDRPLDEPDKRFFVDELDKNLPSQVLPDPENLPFNIFAGAFEVLDGKKRLQFFNRDAAFLVRFLVTQDDLFRLYTEIPHE